MRFFVSLLAYSLCLSACFASDADSVLALKQKAKAGDVVAQYELGQFYENPTPNQPANLMMARFWYEQSATSYPAAAKRLGDLLSSGKLVVADPVEATHYYRQAVQMGSAPAEVALGDLYAKGIGVKRDKVKMVACYASGSSHGHADAQYKLANLYFKGEGVKKDLSTALTFYEQAAEQDHVDAQLRLGFLYDKGKGVKKDLEKAHYWYRRAAYLGEERAQYKLGWALTKNQALQNKPEALAWLTLASEKGSRLSGMYRKKLTRQLSQEELEKSHNILLALREQGL